MCFCHQLFLVWRCLSLCLSSDDGHVCVHQGRVLFVYFVDVLLWPGWLGNQFDRCDGMSRITIKMTGQQTILNFHAMHFRKLKWQIVCLKVLRDVVAKLSMHPAGHATQ